MKNEKKVNLKTIISRNPEIIHSLMDKEVVMMSGDQGLFFGIDTIGARIWNMLETPAKVEDLIEKLVADYDVEHSVCQNDTLQFLNEMLVKKVILVSELD